MILLSPLPSDTKTVVSQHTSKLTVGTTSESIHTQVNPQHSGGHVKALKNHAEKSFQPGACNSEPSPHPFAVRQQ